MPSFEPFPSGPAVTGTLGDKLLLPKFYQIEKIGSGELAIMGRPRAGEWAVEEFHGLAQLGVTNVVSLLEPSEAYELGLANEATYCSDAGIRYQSFPITDRGVPDSPTRLAQLACGIYHSCAGGALTLVHCRAGIGRSSIVAATVLLHCGMAVAEAFDHISKSRGLVVPDTPGQKEWLIRNETEVATCHLQTDGIFC